MDTCIGRHCHLTAKLCHFFGSHCLFTHRKFIERNSMCIFIFYHPVSFHLFSKNSQRKNLSHHSHSKDYFYHSYCCGTSTDCYIDTYAAYSRRHKCSLRATLSTG